MPWKDQQINKTRNENSFGILLGILFLPLLVTHLKSFHIGFLLFEREKFKSPGAVEKEVWWFFFLLPPPSKRSIASRADSYRLQLPFPGPAGSRRSSDAQYLHLELQLPCRTPGAQPFCCRPLRHLPHPSVLSSYCR